MIFLKCYLYDSTPYKPLILFVIYLPSTKSDWISEILYSKTFFNL